MSKTLARHDRYIASSSGSEVHRFFVSSDELENDISFIRQHKIDRLMVDAQYWKPTNIDELIELGDLVKELAIFPKHQTRFCFTALSKFNKLEELRIYNFKNETIDVSSNTNLRGLLVESCVKLIGLESLIKLENVALTKPSEALLNFEVFSNLENLNSLTLCKCILKDGVEFLERSGISVLWLFEIKHLNCRGINKLGLSELVLDKCKSVENSQLIFQAESLSRLKFIDAINVATAEDILKLNSLELLVISGTSILEDGDFAPLKYKLKYIGYANKRHYSIKHEEFREKYLKE